MRDVVRRMKPNRIEDPSPPTPSTRPADGNIDSYIATENMANAGRRRIRSWMTCSARPTHHVYQEQFSRLVNRLGGIELKRAFRLAKANQQEEDLDDRGGARAVRRRLRKERG